jgi:hypothetical protein
MDRILPISRTWGNPFFLQQAAEKVRQPVLFIWSVWFVLFVWLNETNQMNQINQRNQMDQID